MRAGLGGILLAALLCSASPVALAQGLSTAAEAGRDPVALVADSVEYDERAGTVTARGNVEVFQGLRTLTASEIVYESRTGLIRATGPIVLRDSTGSTVIADAATLDSSLREGIIQGARAIVGESGGTLAAVEGQRVDGRYSVLSRVVYSACEVCTASPVPLWQIRARRVVHDQQERMIHYEGAIFDVAGVPVAYLPFFSHPDPTVERRSGFLAPTFKSSNTFGFAVQAPYFIDLGPSRDATITAYPTTADGPIMLGEYRQAFDNGRMSFEGSGAVVDTGTDGDWQGRGHLFGRGAFNVGSALEDMLGAGRDTTASFNLQLVSDSTYLDRYDLSESDRLASDAYLQRWGRDGFFRFGAVSFQSLRETEFDEKRMFLLPEFAGRQTMALDGNLGTVGIDANSVYLGRLEGRDTGRIGFGADWETGIILPIGLALRGFAEAKMDGYLIRDDESFEDDTAFRIHPQIGAEARYPLVATFMGTTHLVEPGVQLIVSPDDTDQDDIPNEDSVNVEFDESGIFSRNRFPGRDRVETGTRLNVGVRYARVADDPLTLDASFGRVFRLSDDSAFSDESGLVSRQSDFVAGFGVGYAPFFNLTNSIRLDDDFELRRTEVQGVLNLRPAQLTASYVFLGSDPTAGAEEDRAEFHATANVQLTRNWNVGGLLRQDLENDQTVRVGGRVGYRNECTALEFFVGRDYPNRSDEDAEFLVGLRVQVLGQADPSRRAAGSCARTALRTN